MFIRIKGGCVERHNARSSNGRTMPSEGIYLGSNPGLAAVSISDNDILELLSNRKNNPEDFDISLIKRAQDIMQA